MIKENIIIGRRQSLVTWDMLVVIKGRSNQGDSTKLTETPSVVQHLQKAHTQRLHEMFSTHSQKQKQEGLPAISI
jgi:hypothetical protein